MYKKDFYFNLPNKLIAQYPLAKRTASRLLVYNRKVEYQYHHAFFKNLPDFLEAGDVLVMNNSKVIPARLYGHKDSGAKIELLIERLLSSDSFLAHIKTNRSPKEGTKLNLEKNWQIIVHSKQQNGLYLCQLLHSEDKVDLMLQDIGHIPIPPYIKRADNVLDKSRYQTVYAHYNGSVAAPTAGLHFDNTLLHQLQDKGVKLAYVTLHVGSGTFKPVRCELITEHLMHSEYIQVDQATCQLINSARATGKRIIAVGTTALRCLETATINGVLKPYDGDTNIFIHPGYRFQICNGLITNFHLPESTLLMLVAALIGHHQTMSLYQEAIIQRYRFFSYGDASLLL